MPNDESTDPTGRSAIGRRTVITGAAWALPAVALAVAAPQAAASGGSIVVGTASWDPDDKTGQVQMQLNPAPGPDLATATTVYDSPTVQTSYIFYAIADSGLVTLGYTGTSATPDSFTATISIPGYGDAQFTVPS